MIDLREGELADILPIQFTKQPEVVAVSYALKQAYQDYCDCEINLLVYAFIDGAPEYVLDLLAVELRTRYYQTDFPVETKRSLIKNAILVALKDGTRFAVDSVIQSVFGEGYAEDWYEYEGTPNHYRIILESNGSFEVDTLVATIEGVKRKTARLDGITINSDYDNPLYFGSITAFDMELEIGCEDMPEIDGDVVFYADEDSDYLADENEAIFYEIEEVEEEEEEET